MDLSEEHRARLAQIAEKHRLDLILMFGSSVTGKLHPGSDCDIAVSRPDGIPDFRTFGQIGADLQEVFHEREVDLVVLERADPLLLWKIAESSVLLYGRPEALARLKIYAFKRYHDHRPYFEMERRFLRRFLDERAQGAAGL